MRFRGGTPVGRVRGVNAGPSPRPRVPISIWLANGAKVGTLLWLGTFIVWIVHGSTTTFPNLISNFSFTPRSCLFPRVRAGAVPWYGRIRATHSVERRCRAVTEPRPVARKPLPSMNRVKEIERINAKDVALQLASDTVGNSGKWDINKSWHAQYKDSAYVYVGGLPPDLSEGDIVVVFSQFGEIVDVNMPRDKDTGKTRGFAFIGYEDQRSTALAVDNFNGAKLLGRTLRCDHCASYHEEQKKDPAKLPDHVARKLSDAQLEEKQRGIERRNAELDEASAAKAELFAQGRGLETEEEH